MKFFEIGTDGNHKVPQSKHTTKIAGQKILKVGFVSENDVVVVAERGLARGPAKDVLPLELRRSLGPLWKRARMLPPEFQTSDKTYDTDSTVDSPFKPKQDPVLHPKEQAIRQTGEQKQDILPEEQDPQIQQKLKDEQNTLHAKEKQTRTTVASRVSDLLRWASPESAALKLKATMGGDATLLFMKGPKAGYWDIMAGKDQEDVTGLVAQSLDIKPKPPEWVMGKLQGDPQTLAQQLQLVLNHPVKAKIHVPRPEDYMVPKKKN